MGETTTIPLTKETKDLLKKHGRKGETYGQLIRRLVEVAEQLEFAESQKRIIAEEEFTLVAKYRVLLSETTVSQLNLLDMKRKERIKEH